MTFLERLIGDLIATTPAEAVAVVLAFAYVVLAVRRSLWCWPCAFLSTSIYLVLFARAGLYMQSALQVFYLAMAVYGFIDWRRGRTDSGSVAITVRSSSWHLVVIVLILAATLVNGVLLARQTAAAAPYLDAFVTWSSLAATWMIARRMLENWAYWIVIDAAAAALYFSQGLALTAVLFVAYVGIAARGLLSWLREWQAQRQGCASEPAEGLAPAAGHDR
jgi:nicotinamide mononucleotide transporter